MAQTNNNNDVEVTIKLVQTDDEIADCYPAMKQLRTELAEDVFVSTVRELMSDGFQLAGLRAENQVACVAGFRISSNLVLGKHLYVEDLATLEVARSRGHGTQMMAWLRSLAKAEGCTVLHLDSGVQRYRAHKFYLNQDMFIVSYHFAQKIA